MSSRTYLSIGDVLTLLREEFPDVTISKIRFLESQGLVNPERSPSGYRKFFDHDVERLRWVLRQQREHFLPLKVIRDRLADGELDDAAAGTSNGPANGKETAGARAEQPVHVGATAGAGGVGAARVAGGAALPSDEPTKADEEAMARILADASRRAALLPEDAPARRALQGIDDGTTAAPLATTTATATAARGEAPAGAGAHAQARRGKGAPAAAPGGPGGPGDPSDPAGTPTPAPHPRSGGAKDARDKADAKDKPGETPAASTTRGGGGGNGSSRAGSAGSSASSGSARTSGSGRKGSSQAEGSTEAVAGDTGSSGAGGTVAGASLTAEELANASGLSPEEVAGLVSYGLIEPVVVAGIETYDEDALTLANLSASFRVYGIEPRHLRMYRNAVDREIGLIEQVVIPLLRQRNPESRQRAVEAAEELGTLGQSMRATLLRQGLRRHLGG